MSSSAEPHHIPVLGSRFLASIMVQDKKYKQGTKSRSNIRVPDRAGEPKSYVFSDKENILAKIAMFALYFLTRAQNVALECFSEAESAAIRTGAKFCFDLYVEIFSQLFQKIFF